MAAKLKIDIKRAVKFSWIATNTFLLQLSLGSYLLYPDRAFRNDDTIQYVMLLSFPSSIPTTILTANIIGVNPPIDYIAICLVAFLSGYLQWFWCVPKIFQKREIISLQLTSPERELGPITTANSPRRRKPYQSHLPRAPFDKTGHSPLERAIGIKRG
ncbi:MAG: hypothetical protein ND866_15090 [Pyrinomonadaceae bacterium]|nr:hypothetical protein [Pyrinomonadaceae bacterium]